MRTVDLGNNESKSIGVVELPATGRWMALTLSQSKIFQTRKGAERWLARRGYNADGSRIEAEAVTFHIRTATRSAQYGGATLCGAPVTAKDAPHVDRLRVKSWPGHDLCATCVEACQNSVAVRP